MTFDGRTSGTLVGWLVGVAAMNGGIGVGVVRITGIVGIDMTGCGVGVFPGAFVGSGDGVRLGIETVGKTTEAG